MQKFNWFWRNKWKFSNPTDTVEEWPKNEQYHEYIPQYENQNPSNSNIWSVLVNQCRYLLQEEYGYDQMNSSLITKILIKEANGLLVDIVRFFQECCNPITEQEEYNEGTLEIDGLLVNCLPCHPQNLKCYYKVV